MRIRLDPVGTFNADLIARQFGRSPSNAAHVALAEFVRNNIGAGKIMQPDEADAIFGSGRAIAAHASGALASAVKKFAAREDRSLSSAIKVLLRQALEQQGIRIHYRPVAPADVTQA